MTQSLKDTILEEAISWIESNQQVALATVIKTWGSSPFQVGSKMIINKKGNFFGSVSGGCVETSVITECLELIKNKNSFKKIDFKVSDENAWDVGLACGGEMTVFIEQIN
jgi:xanthine/CO dehydrogenase XdhC/CoxF family maturation factor